MNDRSASALKVNDKGIPLLEVWAVLEAEVFGFREGVRRHGFGNALNFVAVEFKDRIADLLHGALVPATDTTRNEVIHINGIRVAFGAEDYRLMAEAAKHRALNTLDGEGQHA